MAGPQALTDSHGKRCAQFINEVRRLWALQGGPTERANAVCTRMVGVLFGPGEEEPWAADLWRERPRARELYRDPEHGFIQMGHVHAGGHTTALHDHGPGWVVYGVHRGEIEIPTFHRPSASDDREARLSVLDTQWLTAGMAHAYLPGEVHATRALAPEGSVVLRFLSTDLDKVRRSHYAWSQVTASEVRAFARIRVRGRLTRPCAPVTETGSAAT